MSIKSKFLHRALKGLLLFALLIALWQLVYFILVERAAVWKPYVFPSPLGVVKAFVKLLQNGTLLVGVGQTLRRIGVGYGISVLIGLFSGLLLARFKTLSELLRPIVLGIQTLPSICWVPFAVLWYGLAEGATIFIVVVGSAFSICIAVETGIRGINPLYIRAAKTMGAKGAALYAKVILPAGVPALVGALKQGWSFAWRALMTGEMMVSSKGIGLMLSQAREMGGINEVAAVMLVIVFISVVVDKLIFGLIEKRAAYE